MMDGARAWLEKGGQGLLVGMPSRSRAAGETLFVLALVFLPSLAAQAGRIALQLCTFALVFAAERFVDPVREFRTRAWGRGLVVTLLLAVGLAAAMVEAWQGTGVSARAPLGLELEEVGLRAGVDAGVGAAGSATVLPGALRVRAVRSQSAAEGLVEPGDVVIAVDGEPLGAVTPLDEALERLEARVSSGAETVSLQLERGDDVRLATVPLAGTRAPAVERLGDSLLWLCVRGFGVIVLVSLLVWRDGQNAATLGLFAKGFWKDVAFTAPVLVGTYVALFSVSLPLTLLGNWLGLAKGELEARRAVADALLGTGLSVPAFFLTMLCVAAFEETVFRGFLMPRLRWLTGSWFVALGVMAVAFGAGHGYEGALAVVQTAMLGLIFGVAFLSRGRLVTVVLAHAVFNSASYVAILVMQRFGFLDALPRLVGKGG